MTDDADAVDLLRQLLAQQAKLNDTLQRHTAATLALSLEVYSVRTALQTIDDALIPPRLRWILNYVARALGLMLIAEGLRLAYVWVHK